MKLFEAGLMDEPKVLEEINSKNALSVELDENDLGTVHDTGLGGEGEGEGLEDKPSDPTEELKRLRNSVYVRNADSLSVLIKAAGGDPDEVGRKEFNKGMDVEQEHGDTVGGDLVTVAKIVLDHLNEDPDYYTKLEKVENANLSSVAGAIKRAQGTKKDKIYLDLGFNDRQALLERLILELPRGSRRVSSMRSEIGRIAGTFAETDVTEKLLRGMAGMHPKKIDVNFTHGLDEVILNAIDLDPLPQPSRRQTHAGNYKKHHMKLHGFDVAIENPQGSTRKGVSPDGTEWECELPAHYGYVKRTTGADGDHVDIYVGPQEESELVFVVDQKDADTGEFDEHKCIFGALGLTQAKELYLGGFSDGKGESRLGAITPMHVSQFRQWVDAGDMKSPFSTDL